MANICSKCRRENPQENEFCGSCGTPLLITQNTQSKMISFPDAIKLGFLRAFDFKGRSTRAEYWWFQLFLLLAYLVLIGIDAMIGTFNPDFGVGFLSGLGWLATFIPSLSLGIRRLHDINKEGKWILLSFPVYLDILISLPLAISFIFFITCLPLIWWAIQPSNKEANKYGPPRQQTTSQ